MDNVLLMHVGNTLQDLLHVARTGRLCVLKAVVHNSFKQFPACDTTDKSQWQQMVIIFLCIQPEFADAIRIQPLWTFAVILTTPWPWPSQACGRMLRDTERVWGCGGSSSVLSLYGQPPSPWHVGLCRTSQHTLVLSLCGLAWTPGRIFP